MYEPSHKSLRNDIVFTIALLAVLADEYLVRKEADAKSEAVTVRSQS